MLETKAESRFEIRRASPVPEQSFVLIERADLATAR